MTLILPRAYKEDPAHFDGMSLTRRDPAYLGDFLPLLEPVARYYFQLDARGFDRVDAATPFIAVGNHNGGINSPDTAMALREWYRQHDVQSPFFALIHPGIFAVPYLNVHAMKVGGIAATAKMAVKVLERGAPLLMYPGGGDDAYKPYHRRHEILFFGRDAFVRMALKYDVPVVPIVSIGAHETLIVLDDGVERAKLLGLDKLGIDRLPATYSLPYGFSLGTPLNIPFRTHITLEMGEPMHFSDGGRNSHKDPDYVKHCYDVVVRTMQAMQDGLVSERQAASGQRHAG